MIHQDVQDILQNWEEEKRNVAQEIVDKYGEPDEMTPSILIWHDNGPWHATVVTRNATRHTFPMPHTDLVEQFVHYRVPPDKVSDLAAYDGSVMVRRTEGLISARCHDEPANFLALNLAHDIISGKKSVEEAREAYVQALKDFRAKRPTPYMEGLQFQPQPDAPDPGRQMISKEELEAAKQQA
ncbi:MAG: hypothetical protein ACOC9X_00760 [bacterium]